MAQGDLHETVAVCATADQAGLNVRHWFEDIQSGNGATLPEFVAALSTLVAPAYKELLNENARYVGMTAKRVRPLPPSATFSSADGAGVGLRPGDLLPKQVAGLISYVPDPLFGSEKGRSYVPFPSEISSDSLGKPTTTYTADLLILGNIYATVLAVVGAAGTSLYVPSIFTRSTGDFGPIQIAQAAARWATQRRRGDFGQPNIIIGI